MSLIRYQIEQIRIGGLLVLCRKARALIRVLLASRHGLRLVSHGYKLAIFFNSSWVRAHVGLGRNLTNLGHVDDAIFHWQKVVTLKPDFAEARVELAESLIGLGRFDEALAFSEQAFSFQPEWPEVHSRIQNAFYFSGQRWAARAILQQVLDVQNDFARAHQLDNLGIRFLKEFPTAIGHIALLDSYVKSGILGRRFPSNPIVLVQASLTNAHYLEYWRQYLPSMITDPMACDLLSQIARYLEDRISNVMDASGQQIVDEVYDGTAQQAAVQAQWETEGRGPLLTLTESDHERGWRCLQTLDVPPDAWFVGLHVREGRENSRAARDASVDTYRLAMESVVERGGWVIRMGDPSMTQLPPMPQVIDYAHSAVRIDWMDVFLWARCRFFIGTQSGPAWVPPTFGVPCVATNWTFHSRRWFGQDLFIPKLLWSESEERYFSFAETLTSEEGITESLDHLAFKGVRFVDNTAEEIRDVVVEMLDRLEGKAMYSREDEELQKRFDQMWTSHAHHANGQIGREYLRKWTHLV